MGAGGIGGVHVVHLYGQIGLKPLGMDAPPRTVGRGAPQK